MVGKGLTLEFMSVRFEESIEGEVSRRSFIALHPMKGTAVTRQSLGSRAHVSGDQRQGLGFSFRGSDRLQDRTCSCCYSRVCIETQSCCGINRSAVVLVDRPAFVSLHHVDGRSRSVTDEVRYADYRRLKDVGIIMIIPNC
jgi:hypothetical protein